MFQVKLFKAHLASDEPILSSVGNCTYVHTRIVHRASNDAFSPVAKLPIDDKIRRTLRRSARVLCAFNCFLDILRDELLHIRQGGSENFRRHEIELVRRICRFGCFFR